ncbi:MAG: T9SS type A sorting domain-containing protein [Ginsengibacter sp.]
MKKFIIVIILLVVYGNTFAFLTQANWRWRNDDGTETTATWKAGQNTQAVLSITGEIWRLRLEVYNNTGNNIALIDTLQYATSTSGPWTNIDVTAGSNPFTIASVSAFVVQAEPTTVQLTGVAGYTFATGKVMVDSMILKNINFADQEHTEFEWAIKANSSIVPNTTYYFRQYGSAASPLDAGMTYPSLVTAGVLPIKLTGFNAIRQDKKIKLEWSTNFEQNNDRFEIERSSDGRTWKTISKVNGSGTTKSFNTYQKYDENPLGGINFYLIKQYSLDGHTYISDIKSVRMPDVKSIVSVYPNPAHSGVSFRVVNKNAANVEAILSNINGSIIHQELFKSVSANTNNKLNLQRQPTPGIYVLKLKGEGLSESVRVVIE